MRGWLDRLLGCHGELQALSSSPGSQKKATCQVQWTYATLFSNVHAVAGAMCAASHTHSSPSEASAKPVGGARQSFGERHMVVCGPALLQSVAAIVCSQQEYVGVFVPAEDTDEDTLSNLLVVQRACEASIILIDLEVWNGLSAALIYRLSSVQECTVLVFSSLTGEVLKLEPRGKRFAAYLVPAPSQEPPSPQNASTCSTDPLFIFHQRGKHEAVTLSHEATEAYMQHGVKNLVQAVDPRFNAPAPAATVTAVPDNHVRIRSCAHPQSDGSGRANSIRASPSCADAKLAPCSLLPGSFSATPTAIHSRKGGMNDAVNSGIPSQIPHEQLLHRSESTLTPRSKSLAPMPCASSYRYEPECTGSIPACTPCFLNADDAIPSDFAAPGSYHAASLCGSFHSGGSGYQAAESFLSSRGSFRVHPHCSVVPTAPGASMPTRLASQDIYQTRSNSFFDANLPPPPDVAADMDDDVIGTRQHDARALRPVSPESRVARLAVAQVQGVPGVPAKAPPPGGFFDCNTDLSGNDDHVMATAGMGRAISTAIPAEMYSELPLPWSEGETLRTGAVIDPCMEPMNEPCTVRRAKPCDERAARIADRGGGVSGIEGGVVGGQGRARARDSLLPPLPAANSLSQVAESELCTVRRQQMHKDHAVSRVTDSVLLPVPSMHAFADAELAGEQRTAVAGGMSLGARSVAQRLQRLSVPGMLPEFGEQTPLRNEQHAVHAMRCATPEDSCNGSPRLCVGTPQSHVSPCTSTDGLYNSTLSMLTPQQRGAQHSQHASLMSPSLASLSPEVLQLQECSMHDVSCMTTPQQQRTHASSAPCLSPECIILQEASTPDIYRGETSSCEASPVVRKFIGAQRGIRFGSTSSPSPGSLRVTDQILVTHQTPKKQQSFSPPHRQAPHHRNFSQSLIPRSPLPSPSPSSKVEKLKPTSPLHNPSSSFKKDSYEDQQSVLHGACSSSPIFATPAKAVSASDRHDVCTSVHRSPTEMFDSTESANCSADLDEVIGEAVGEAISDSLLLLQPEPSPALQGVLSSAADLAVMHAHCDSTCHGVASDACACTPCMPRMHSEVSLPITDELMPMWRGGTETEEDEEDRRGAPVAIEINFAGEDSEEPSSKNRDAEWGPSAYLGGGNEGISLPWRSSAWSGSTMRMRTALGAEGNGGMIDTWPSSEEAGTVGQRGATATRMRQPQLLCALPADTPARLLFGLLLPLSMGWHVTLGAAPVDDAQGEMLWNVLCGNGAGAGANAPEATVPYNACYIASAACDMLTRRALEALGGRSSSAGGVGGSAAFSAALSKLAVCALFGPSATPATVQSFVASMLPFGLRRTAISFVCSTWDLPVLCPPLLGLHTLETGVRCAAGDCVSPLGHVAVVASSSRCALPDGTIGSIWVASGSSAHPVTRGMHAVPLQWIFDASSNERQGPYKVTGLAGYVDNGRLFIIGRYEDMLFAPESAHHASDIEAALLGNTPSFALRSFVLKLPPAHTKSDRGRFLQPTHALHARAVTYDRGTAAQKPRGGVERATCPRAWLTLARKSCQSISGGQEGRRGQWGWWGQTGGGGDDPDKVGYGFGGGLLGGGVAMGRCDAADEKQKNEKGGDSSGAVLVVQRLKASKVAKGAKDRVRQLWECLRGVRQRRWHSRQQEQEIVESLAMIKMAWGVQVKEVWSVDAQLPATPMGNIDRSAATSFQGDVRVFHVDEDAGKLRHHQQQALY